MFRIVNTKSSGLKNFTRCTAPQRFTKKYVVPAKFFSYSKANKKFSFDVRTVGLGFAGIVALFSSAAFFQSSAEDKKEEKKEEKKLHNEESPLDPNNFKEFFLKEVLPVNYNTKIFRFHLEPDSTLGLPVASCVLVKGPIGQDGKQTVRPYTPITYDEKGYFDLLIKKYEGGPVSSYVHNLKVGEKLAIKGPYPTIPIKSNMKENIAMIAGGTGITPMLQVIHELTKDPNDKTKMTLIFANVTEKDIILKEQIENLAKKHPNLKVYYVLDKPPENWKGGVGYITAEMIKPLLPTPNNNNLVMVCGPAPMVKMLAGEKTPEHKQGELSGILKGLGYTEQQVWKF
jgi:cytochrome-b5 reductase